MTFGKHERLNAGPFALAILTSTALVLSAPLVGQIRSFVRREFPGHFVMIVGAVCAAGLVLALTAAAWRIRAQRRARYGAILLAVAIALTYSMATATGIPESNAVERFHFLQYGLITFLFYRAWRPAGDASVLVLPLLAGLIVGAAEEWLQWFIPNRVGEMRDVLLNGVAIISGLLFSLGVDPPGRLTVVSARSARRVARLAAVTLFVFGVFFHVVHLGSEIQDGETGRFTSRYRMSQLLGIQEERTARWQAAPPPTTLVRLSREDQYLTEGVQHVRERNRKWMEGDLRSGWLENRILEKYYAPVLDTPTHEGAGHRWSPEQREDAASRVDTLPANGSYVSAAYPYHIVTWSPAVFWVCVGGLVSLLLVRGFRGGVGLGE